MTRPGELLYRDDGRGALELANDWEAEVRNCVEFGVPLPLGSWAVDLSVPSIRNVTAAFEAAVRDAERPEAGFPGSYVIREGRAA